MDNPNADTRGVHLWLILMKAHQTLQKHAERSLKPNDLCFSDFMILEVLLHKGPMPINQIGERIMLTSGSLTAAADRLEKRGWVTRQPHATDRRARILHLTAEGESIIRKLFERHATYFEDLMQELSADERQTLLGLLKKLGRQAEARL